MKYSIGNPSVRESIMSWLDAVYTTECSWYTDRTGYAEISFVFEGMQNGVGTNISTYTQ